MEQPTDTLAAATARANLLHFAWTVVTQTTERTQTEKWRDAYLRWCDNYRLNKTPRQELLESAWGLIANASDGDWSKQSEFWREIAAAWRDRYMTEEKTQEQVERMMTEALKGVVREAHNELLIAELRTDLERQKQKAAAAAEAEAEERERAAQANAHSIRLHIQNLSVYPPAGTPENILPTATFHGVSIAPLTPEGKATIAAAVADAKEKRLLNEFAGQPRVIARRALLEIQRLPEIPEDAAAICDRALKATSTNKTDSREDLFTCIAALQDLAAFGNEPRWGTSKANQIAQHALASIERACAPGMLPEGICREPKPYEKKLAELDPAAASAMRDGDWNTMAAAEQPAEKPGTLLKPAVFVTPAAEPPAKTAPPAHSREAMIEDILDSIRTELKTAMAKHPRWPVNPSEAFAILAEEVGELAQAINDGKGGNPGTASFRTRARTRAEAIQVAAMAVEFLLHGYNWTDTTQPK